MKCIGCGRKPEELIEYVIMSQLHGITPEEFVIQYESTYNTFEPNRFYCTPCYIESGMPLIHQK